MSSAPQTTLAPAFGGENPNVAGDRALLPKVVEAVRAAGDQLLGRYSPDNRQRDLAELLSAIDANDAASLSVLKPALLSARPGAGWAGDKNASGPLPPGEWWVVDPVEGNVNHIHGMAAWGVTATLVRDNRPVLAVIHLPLSGDLYTAVAGGGAFQNGTPLRPSEKRAFEAALVATGQAEPREAEEILRRIGDSVAVMLREVLSVRVAVPSTLELIELAAGRTDVVWQYNPARTGLLAGALLIAEAGGTITTTHGGTWSLDSADLLAAAPGLHGDAVRALSTVN
jgi:myo-inositol-1(or 4)-monophosphatase